MGVGIRAQIPNPSGRNSGSMRTKTRSQLPARNGGWEEGGQDGDRSSVHLSRYFCCYPCRLPELWVETGGSRSWPLGVRCPRPDLGREKQGLGMAFGLHAEKLHGLVPRMWVPGHGIVLGARARSRNRALALFLSGLVASGPGLEGVGSGLGPGLSPCLPPLPLGPGREPGAWGGWRGRRPEAWGGGEEAEAWGGGEDNPERSDKKKGSGGSGGSTTPAAELS